MTTEEFTNQANDIFKQLCITKQHKTLSFEPFNTTYISAIALSVIHTAEECKHEKTLQDILRDDTAIGLATRRLRLNRIIRNTMGFKKWYDDGSYLCTALINAARSHSNTDLNSLIHNIQNGQ